MVIALGLLIWVAASVVLAPLVGTFLRRCDIEEQRFSVEILQAKAQHPTRHAA